MGIIFSRASDYGGTRGLLGSMYVSESGSENCFHKHVHKVLYNYKL